MDDNTKELVDELQRLEHSNGELRSQVDLLIGILFLNAEKEGKNYYRYARLDDVSVDGRTILTIFGAEYPKRIVDLFADKGKEEENGDTV